MADRFTLLYRFSTDYGATWVDLTPQVDSLQTSITNNLCTNNFTSAKDEATFVMPETPLFEADGVTPTPKKLLIDALMGNDDILIEINAPGPVNVLWDNNLVLWNGNEVLWKNSTRRFTGYADRSSISLRSYPLPPNLTVKVQDVSTLHLDDKVSENICLEGKKISEIVSALLGYAGYTDIGRTALDVADDVVLEAFVIDKDKANSYRSYIDTLLFEAGGYVLDFNEDGQANVVHLQWDGSVVASRAIDNPMNADGVSIRSAYLKEDGVKLKWSTLAWSGAGQKIWQSNISQESVDGVLTGEKIQPGRYWPDGGEITPQFMQYDAKLLDSAYLTRESRKQNEDLTIIMAKDVSVRMDAMRNGQPYTFPIPAGYPIPTSPTDFTAPPYNLTQNPTIWPTKAWYLLYNNENSDIDLLFFSIYGNVLYRQKLNTVETANSSNPKEYESTYIYSESHAQRFLQFYWHFLQTSRYQFSWKEPNRSDALNAVVAVGIKGNGSTQKALIAGKTSTWVHDNMEIISYSAVGIDTYSPATLVPVVIAPSSATPQVQPTRSAIAAAFSTVPSFTLAEWQDMGKTGTALSWTVTNASSFNAGDLAVINGKISDMDNTDIQLYMDVSAVDTVNGTISGTAVSIQYVPITKNWDFTLNTEIYIINRRDVSNVTEVIARANIKGYPSAVLEWEARDASGTTISTGSGSTFTVYIPFENANNYVSPISIIMSDQNGLVTPLEKKISAIEETEYDHDFGAWEPQTEGTRIYVLPDHFDSYTVIDGDFFVAKVTFSLQGTAVSSPTGNPNEQGWMERYGNGTGTKPYYYLVSTDTSVQGGKTYYVAAGDIYTEGIPYIYNNNSWNNAIPATAENSGRLLQCLGTVLSDPNIQPSTSALYAWFENLVAKNAIIKTLNATDALFENIHVSGLSRFDGEIHSSALETTLYRPGGGTQTLSLDTNNQFWSYNSFADILNTVFPSDGYYSTTGTYTVWRKGTGNLLLHSITTDSALPDNTTIYTSTRKQNLIVSVTGISGGRLICDGVQYTLLYSDYPSVIIPVDNGSVIKTRGNFVIRDGGLYVHDNQADFSRKFTPFNSSRVPVALADYGSGSITVTYNSTTYTSPALYKWLGMSSASGGGYTSPGSTLSFTDEMGNAVSGHAISSVFWTSASEITFLDSNLDRYSIDTASYYRAFSASFSIAASIDSVVAATITPASSSATLGTPSNPWPAIHGDEVYGAVFN